MEVVVDIRPEDQLATDGQVNGDTEGEKDLDLDQTQDQDRDQGNGSTSSQAGSQQQEPSSSVIQAQPSNEQSASIDFVTLGMFIIDDIDFLPPTPPVRNILGGAGTYSALGARLYSPHPQSASVGWIIDQGSDFPPALSTLIDSWATSALFRHDALRLTTRGWNGYESAAEKRAFKYLTPKKRLTAHDLTPTLLQSRSFHLICSPNRCRELVPNHAELAGFMGDDGLDPETGEISTLAVERSCEQLLASMPLQSFALVIRAGDKGCYIAKNGGRKRQRDPKSTTKRRKKDYVRGGLQPDTDMEALFAGLLQDADGIIAREEIEVDPGIERWIPAYHRDSSKVIDPTGGGNTFLGGLGIALARGETLEDAAIWGAVAASFAIEQVGVPTLARDADGREAWNGHNVEDRLREFRERL
ncbi:hypothetical protein ACJ41O_008337 [Fusarium nematophilum]